MNHFEAVTKCRACSGQNLVPTLDIGEQALSGVFPKIGDTDPISGPLAIGFCQDCELVQLLHRFPSELMYGDNYGYRSGLNSSMRKHLERMALHYYVAAGCTPNSTVLDIGSNDGTLLNSLVKTGSKLIGMDPTSKKFGEYYDSTITRVADFFSASRFLESNNPADLIFSVAMFYDLEDPVGFAKQIKESLTKDGIWHFEQSYLFSMIDTHSFDTICHEHVEYYSLKSLEWILSQADMKILDIELNDINGGSIGVTAGKIESNHVEKPMVGWLRSYENRRSPNLADTLTDFKSSVQLQRETLVDLINTLHASGAKIWGVGASTKGNVLLQYCGFDSTLLEAIADVNSFKFGRVTPGTRIPIKTEAEMLDAKPDYALVLPWHFKPTIVERSGEYLENGGRLIFPLPNLSFV